MTTTTWINSTAPLSNRTPVFELHRRRDGHEVDRVATSLRALGADHSGQTVDTAPEFAEAT